MGVARRTTVCKGIEEILDEFRRDMKQHMQNIQQLMQQHMQIMQGHMLDCHQKTMDILRFLNFLMCLVY